MQVEISILDSFSRNGCNGSRQEISLGRFSGSEVVPTICSGASARSAIHQFFFHRYSADKVTVLGRAMFATERMMDSYGLADDTRLAVDKRNRTQDVMMICK